MQVRPCIKAWIADCRPQLAIIHVHALWYNMRFIKLWALLMSVNGLATSNLSAHLTMCQVNFLPTSTYERWSFLRDLPIHLWRGMPANQNFEDCIIKCKARTIDNNSPTLLKVFQGDTSRTLKMLSKCLRRGYKALHEWRFCQTARIEDLLHNGCLAQTWIVIGLHVYLQVQISWIIVMTTWQGGLLVLIPYVNEYIVHYIMSNSNSTLHTDPIYVIS